MNLKTKVLIALFNAAASLAVFTVAQAEPIRAGGSAPAAQVVVPGTRPEQGSLVPVSAIPLVVAGSTVGRIVAYDDPATPRGVDGFELIDSMGGLVALGWFDRFGIRRLAVDRALVEGGDELVGELVLVVEGDTI